MNVEQSDNVRQGLTGTDSVCLTYNARRAPKSPILLRQASYMIMHICRICSAYHMVACWTTNVYSCKSIDRSAHIICDVVAVVTMLCKLSMLFHQPRRHTKC